MDTTHVDAKELCIRSVQIMADGTFEDFEAGPPVLHRHAYSETFLFQEGAFEVSTVDADYALSTVRVGAGDTVSIPSMA